MIDVSNMWGLLFWFSVACLVAWAIYPGVRNLYASFFSNIHLSRLILIVFIGLFGWSIKYISDSFQKKVEPPSFISIQQQFKRFEKDRKKFSLDENWRALKLSQDKGWVDSGIDFKAGDYFWVVSYDSCLIKLQSFNSGKIANDLVVGGIYQASCGEKTAVSLKNPLKYPPIYYNDERNTFIKYWSIESAKNKKDIALFFGIFLAAIALLVSAIGIEFELVKQRLSDDSVEILSDEEVEAYKGKWGTQVMNTELDISAVDKSDRQRIQKVLTNLVQQIEWHHNDSTKLRHIVSNYSQVLIHNSNRKWIQSQIENLEAYNKTMVALKECLKSEVDLKTFHLDEEIIVKEKKKQSALTDAELEENLLRADQARAQRDKIKNINNDKTREQVCQQILASNRIKLKAVEFDAYKDYPELREQLQNSSDKNIIEILEQRIDDGISPKTLKILIERILKDQNQKKPKAQERAEEYRDVSNEARADLRGQFELRQAIYDEFDLMKKDIERRQELDLISSERAKEELDAAKRMVDEKLRGL